ncbi:MAG: hypothetical protein QOH98_2210, partial [Methylobacteriaceae bacterium]|nr:hypothetical protein [Methylobacteriaceae bacterium]
LEEAIALADRVLILSRGPAQLLGDVAVPIPRQERSHADMAAIKRRIAAHIGGELDEHEKGS